jgi:hypothetical protein
MIGSPFRSEFELPKADQPEPEIVSVLPGVGRRPEPGPSEHGRSLQRRADVAEDERGFNPQSTSNIALHGEVKHVFRGSLAFGFQLAPWLAIRVPVSKVRTGPERALRVSRHIR